MVFNTPTSTFSWYNPSIVSQLIKKKTESKTSSFCSQFTVIRLCGHFVIDGHCKNTTESSLSISQKHPKQTFLLLHLENTYNPLAFLREHFQKLEWVPIIGIRTESDSDCGESEVFYRARFGLPIPIKIFQMWPVWVSSDAGNPTIDLIH